ncbi:MAG: acyloxyacyl hydrolase, partial [Bacteroidota bacterium]
MLILTTFLTAQSSGPLSVRELYDLFDRQLPDTLSGNAHRYHPKFGASVSYGFNFLNGRFGSLADLPRYWSADLRGSVQATGRRLYQELWRYPEWGVGVARTSFVNDTLFGAPLAGYGYIDVPLLRYGPDQKWNLGFHFSTGLSTNFRRYDPVSNRLNTFISSRLNVYIDVGGWLGVRLSPHLDLQGGVSLIHFSNGAIKQPNSGINAFGPRLQLQYHLYERPQVYRRDEIPEWKARHGPFVYQAIGTKQLTIGGSRYLNTTTALGYQWWSGYRHRWLAQLDYFYDRSNNSGEASRIIVPDEDRDNPANYRSLGLFVGHEAIHNRWSLVVGAGVYVWRRYEYNRVLYQRFGIRYRVWNGLAVGVGLKGRTFGADY